MHSNDSQRIAYLERRVNYLIRYLGIDPAHIAGGVMLACYPSGPPTGDGLPPCFEVAPGFEVVPPDARDL